MNKKNLIIIAVVVLIFGFSLYGKKSESGNSNPNNALLPNKENTQNYSGNSTNTRNDADNSNRKAIYFVGEKGENVTLLNGEIKLRSSLFSDGKARFYNVTMPTGKTIYFFVVKDKNGIYRAAANGCQVCFTTGKGFHQEGDEIVCNNCGNRYPIEKIATEKGGCNPGPINPNLKVQNGEIIIKESDLEQVLNLF